MKVLVEAPGLLTTVQDLGRQGWQHLGVGGGGAMDEVSLRIANLLVGNAQGAPALEITLTGPRLRFEAPALVAVCGGDLSPEVDGTPLRLWRPALLREGSRLSFGRPVAGARCCLAVAGGFQVPLAMGSASTHLAAGFGGFQGRALRTGDILETGPCPQDAYPALRRRFARSDRPAMALDWFAPWYREMDFMRPAVLRFIPGPQWEDLAPGSQGAFLEAPFLVRSDSDRMGIRLQGPGLALARQREMVSAGVVMGTVQLPPDGAPILLMADRQTTGGYPRLGEVVSVDLPKAAQLRPREAATFVPATLEEAQELLLARERRFLDLERVLAQRRAQ